MKMFSSTPKLQLLFVVVALLVFGLAHAQETSEPRDILIRNATLLDPGGTGPDRMVSLLVRDGKLEIITEDTITGEDLDEVINANAGFIIGNLEIGAPPNFMVLIADPRENFQVLLDTKKYASFAMHDGRIVKNTLVQVLEEDREAEQEREPQQKRWLAYTPPPLAVPLGYTDKSKWNRFETQLVSGLFSAGLVVDRMNWLSQDASSKDTIGDLSAFEGGEIVQRHCEEMGRLQRRNRERGRARKTIHRSKHHCAVYNGYWWHQQRRSRDRVEGAGGEGRYCGRQHRVQHDSDRNRKSVC